MANAIEINGKKVNLKPWRISKKGAQVDAARAHIEGLGTVYIQVYEPEEHLRARMAARNAVPEQNQTMAMMVEILKATSERLAALEQAVSPTPMPPPTAPSRRRSAAPHPKPSA